EQADRLADVDAVVVDEVLKAPFAVGQFGERGAGESLGVVEHLVEHRLRARRAVARKHLGGLLFGGVAGGGLGAPARRPPGPRASGLINVRMVGLSLPAS